MKRLKDLFQFFITSVVDSEGVSHRTLLAAFVGLVLNQTGFDKSFGVIFTPIDTLGCYDEPFSQFDKNIQSLTEKEKQLLLTRADELHDVGERREKGAFYTPTTFVEMAHSILSFSLGDDWKDKYVVFDGAAGSRNLTKGYSFRELYSSTLDSQDVLMYAPLQGEGGFFQFDFLNDDESKLPQGLQDVFKQNKPIVFFMNPPYFNIRNIKVSHTVKLGMRRMGLSSVCDMSSLFFARVLSLVQKHHLTNVTFAVFCPVSYLSSPLFRKFRQLWCQYFKLDKAVLFSACHFVGTAQDWAIEFAVWKSGQNPTTSEFKHICVDTDENGEIVKIGKKTIYNFDTIDSNYPKLTMDWFSCQPKEPVRFMPGVTSVFKVVSSLKTRFSTDSRVSADHLCTFCCRSALSVNSSLVICGQTGAVLNSSNLGNVEVTPRNFERAVAVFAMMLTLKSDWINGKDYFYRPDENHPQWKRSVVDSVIFSLFSKGSDLVSMYEVDYRGNLYDIPNGFFWVSVENMLRLANKYRNAKTLQTLQKSPEQRFAYRWLLDNINEASEEAICLLDAGNSLIRKTFKYRIDFDKERPEIQINNWDAGWWQLKELWKATDKSGFKELVKLRKIVSESLRKVNLELGWFR
ncbi:MAG: hypothetical protein LBK82_00805 [Planctomycetaceae bacterium]|jgi:hypothetical protein|nr:hypothetical protein [Planctomycetaceae bacterium]